MIESLWRQKAHKIIGALCYDSWKKTNTRLNGKQYKRHRPYSVPVTAQTLVDCLKTNDENRAKAVFLEINDRERVALPIDEIE